MVCLGPRKKEKKASGNSLKKSPTLNTTRLRSSKTNSSLASMMSVNGKKTSTAARSSVEALTNNKRASVISNQSGHNSRPSATTGVTATKPQRSISPLNATRAAGLATAASNASPIANGASRPNSVASSIRSVGASAIGTVGKPTGKRYPITEMKEEVKDLKAKNEENLRLIAEQKAELERLKLQLQQQQKQHEQNNDRHNAFKQHSSGLKDEVNAKDDTKDNDGDCNFLMQQPKSPNSLPSVKSERQERNNTNSVEIQLLLHENEALLREQKELVEDKNGKNMEQVLEELKSKMNDASLDDHEKTDKEALGQIDELYKQLEEQKKSHEESLRLHEEMLAEKENQLNEQRKSLEALKQSHMDELCKLQTTQSESILSLKKKHAQERSELMKQLEEAKKQATKAAANAQSATSAINLDEHLERILQEFEQAEHTHAVELKDLERSHQSQLDTLENNQQNELNKLLKHDTKAKRDSGKWTTRFQPTEAVSWPLPSREQLTKLRPTSPAPLVESKSKTLLKALSNTVMPTKAEPVLTPLDPKKVQIYYSSVSGHSIIKKNQEKIQQLLQAQNIPFSLVDVASSEAARQYAKRCNNNGSTTGRIKEFPQLYVGGEYRGQFEDVMRAIDEGTLLELLRAATERQFTAEEKAAIQKAEMNEKLASAVIKNQEELPNASRNDTMTEDIPTLKPSVRQVRILKEDEDEELFRELEKELSEGKEINLDDL
ncbi:hypothetical protein BDF20DRAFT_827895 [Mycotypha africana]|uniref:uncharacterized protein n=1 Tax=Mycotypha africana TaxID=64632 RepID=UPI002301A87C|nr:uncharacterized protein BDF20DRAFT_827895 [Mycotypha africana]KAI8968346.1 hypothetical protein BDF20DRAFT_827895 [Mycotypha africana]